MTDGQTVDIQSRDNRILELALFVLLIAEAVIGGMLERQSVPYAIGAGAGIFIGSLLLSLIVYGIVRAIRGKDRGPVALRFVMICAVIVGALGVVAQAVWPTSGSSVASISQLQGQNDSSAAATTANSSVPATQQQRPGADTQNSWGIPPLVAGPWQDASSDAQSARVLLDEIINQCPEEYRDQARSISRIRMMPLPFFSDGAELVEGLVRYRSKPAVFTVLAYGGQVYFMDGSLAPFRELIDRTPIHLERDADATAYLSVASSTVSASNGTFKVVNSVDDLDWLPSATDSDRQNAAKLVRPTVWSKTDDGLKASATVQYGSGIHTVVYLIHTVGYNRGQIEMTDDFSLADGLPVAEMAFKGPLRYQIGDLQ